MSNILKESKESGEKQFFPLRNNEEEEEDLTGYYIPPRYLNKKGKG